MDGSQVIVYLEDTQLCDACVRYCEYHFAITSGMKSPVRNRYSNGCDSLATSAEWPITDYQTDSSEEHNLLNGKSSEWHQRKRG